MGLLLQSAYLQASTVDEHFSIRHGTHPPIHLKTMPHQHVAPIVRNMCMNNRTRAVTDNRDETKGLEEIDMEILNDYSKQIDDTLRQALDLVRTGSAWHKTAAFWAGHCDSRMCDLCGQEEERSDHFLEMRSSVRE